MERGRGRRGGRGGDGRGGRNGGGRRGGGHGRGRGRGGDDHRRGNQHGGGYGDGEDYRRNNRQGDGGGGYGGGEERPRDLGRNYGGDGGRRDNPENQPSAARRNDGGDDRARDRNRDLNPVPVENPWAPRRLEADDRSSPPQAAQAPSASTEATKAAASDGFGSGKQMVKDAKQLSPVHRPDKGGSSSASTEATKAAASDGFGSGKQMVKDAKQLSPVHRPDKGGSSSVHNVRLRTNHFLVNYKHDSVIMHYDVDVKPETPPKHGRSVKIPKSDLSMIRNKLFSDNPSQFPLSHTAYDGEKNIFSAIRLPTGKFKVDISKGEDSKVCSFIFTIKLVNELKLSKLTEYLRGCTSSIPRDILQGMDLVMKENPTREMISVGRSFYPKVPDSKDDLGHGISGFRGHQQSLKATSQGLSLCLDYSVLAFHKRLPVLEFLSQHINGFSVNAFARFRKDVYNALEGLKVYVNHRRTSQKFVVRGLTEKSARDTSFTLEDPEGKVPPRMVLLVEYFQEKHHKTIVHVNLPCLDVGRPDKRNYVPMEFCEIVEGQRFHKENLDRDAAQRFKAQSLPPPYERRDMISSMVQSKSGPCGGGIAKNFGMDVNMNMTSVEGRVIGPPQLKLGGPKGNLITVSVDGDKCQWNLVGKSVVKGKPIDRWAVLDFSQNERGYNRFGLDPNIFIPKLIERCDKLGIRMTEPLFYEPTSMWKFSSVHLLHELLNGVSERAHKCGGGRLQLLVCVMAKRDPGYKYLKWICETKIGIVTQCCLSNLANKANDQFLANLGMKINAKLGGSNVELSRLPISVGTGHVMFVGADVNHPPSRNESSPSIAAVVGTVNWPASNRYAARVRAQRHRCERILDFGNMCLDLVETYARLNKVRPEKLIIFRDGVSDNQFDMVLNEEFIDLKSAFATINYSPTITIIVAQKRHQTRLFPHTREDGSSTGNVPPGTVVDTKIIHPFEFDFYLCSHYGSLGTSKPTHYHVLYDEHGFSSDVLQKLIYDLCFTMARCTKPVSLVPPVYYADLAAYRGRLYHESVVEGQSPPPAGSSSSSVVGSSSSLASFEERHFKLHGEVENEMFFI